MPDQSDVGSWVVGDRAVDHDAVDTEDVNAESREADLAPLQRSRGSSTRAAERLRDRQRTRDLIERFPGAAPEEQRAIRDEVVTLHLWLASSVARRYGGPNEQEDLVQIAHTGLLEAFDRFDPAQSTYANFAWVTMTGLLRRHLRDHGWSVRPPRSTQEAANVLRAARPDATQELGRTPSTGDLAVYLGWTQDAVASARAAELGLRATSIESLVGDSWEPEHPFEPYHLVEIRRILERATRSLTDDERDLLRMRFLDQMAQSQIAALAGGSQMQVSRRLARLMTKLRVEIGDLNDDQHPAGSSTPH